MPFIWHKETDNITEVSFEDWALWFGARDDRRIVDVTLIGAVRVSTIFSGVHEEELFETKVFGGVLDGTEVRYGTSTEAHKGHKEMVQRVKEAEAAA